MMSSPPGSPLALLGWCSLACHGALQVLRPENAEAFQKRLAPRWWSPPTPGLAAQLSLWLHLNPCCAQMACRHRAVEGYGVSKPRGGWRPCSSPQSWQTMAEAPVGLDWGGMLSRKAFSSRISRLRRSRPRAVCGTGRAVSRLIVEAGQVSLLQSLPGIAAGYIAPAAPCEHS